MSLQKHELQSCFHVVPGVQFCSAGKVLFALKFSAAPKQNIKVQTGIPVSTKAYWKICAKMRSGNSIKPVQKQLLHPSFHRSPAAQLVLGDWTARFSCPFVGHARRVQNHPMPFAAHLHRLQSFKMLKRALEIIGNSIMTMWIANLHFDIIRSANMIVGFDVFKTSFSGHAVRWQRLGYIR